MARLSQTTRESAEYPRSQTSVAYAAVRQDILTGRRAPGEKLKINALALTLQVSPGAIREALSRLVPEQLVVSRDQKGFMVAPLSVEDLEDLTDMRCEIEELALRRSVARAGVEWEANILASTHRLRAAPQLTHHDKSLDPEWIIQHAAFHHALVSACGSQRLLDLHGLLYEQSERYRGLSVHMESRRAVENEHYELMNAALARDADRLVELTLAHIRRTTTLIIERAG